MPPDQTNTAEAVEPAFVEVVQRILDEKSAWVAAPDRDVASSIALRAFVAARMAFEDMHTPATEMLRQRDDAREQRDAHFTEIERAREIIAGQRLENDRLRSRIMELEKALGPFAKAADLFDPLANFAEGLTAWHLREAARVLTEGVK